MAQLSLVPTPIGNLDDITLRALATLKRADVIAAEDTRHSRKLLAHHGVARPLERLDAHTIAARGGPLLDAHEHVAFITDAGTPGISDPGAELVQLALARGHRVEALPGATAFVPALVLSGLPLARFTFEGFLPRKGSGRRERLAALADADATTVFYESPHRLSATLRELVGFCGGERPAAVARELTKRFESVYRGSLAELAERLGEPGVKGEIVVVVGPRPPREAAPDFQREAEALHHSGVSGRDLRRALQALGAPRNLAYELALALERDS